MRRPEFVIGSALTVATERGRKSGLLRAASIAASYREGSCEQAEINASRAIEAAIMLEANKS